MPPARAKNWVFTINNWGDPDVVRLTALVPTEAKYVIYGRERGAEGTPHLQGFVQFTRVLRFNQVKDLLGNTAHIEVAKRTFEAIEYCKKEDDYTEHGEPPVKTARRL